MSTEKRYLRDLSKGNYTIPSDRSATYDDIKLGCLQRIADASELMAKNIHELQRQNQFLREERERYQKLWLRAEKRVSAQKALVTKLKKRLICPSPSGVSEVHQL